jgi:hypothetical protein
MIMKRYDILVNEGFYTMGYHKTKKGKKGKADRLAKKLQTLDIDEGVRIEESSIQAKKIFVNKNASGIFVVQLAVNNQKSSAIYDNNDIKYFDSPEQVIEFVNSQFDSRFTVIEY